MPSNRVNSESLRASLTRRLVGVLTLIGIIGAVAAYFLGAKYAIVAYDRALFDDVTTLAEQVSLERGVVQAYLPPTALRWLLANEGEAVLYRVVDLRTGTIAATNGDLGSLPRDVDTPGQAQYRDVSVKGRTFRVAYTRFNLEPEGVPVLIEIGETTGKQDAVTRSILGGAILFMIIMIGVAVGLVRQGIRSALSPLALLEEEVARRAPTDLTPLDRSHAPGEVQRLVDVVNRQMGRVSEVLESQSHFIANAAHQLRTPLAGLRLQAQLARKAQQAAQREASLAEVEASAERAAHLVDQMLLLSKAEAAGSVLDDTVVDLRQVALRVIERFLPMADRHGVDLGFETDGAAPLIRGNGVLLQELLANLVDNALRYGGQGGTVTVATRRDDQHVLLSVCDNGPGVPEEMRTQVFRRFFRPDSAQQKGAGLGLAIVQEIAERHGGHASLEAAAGGGTRVVVRLPGVRDPVVSSSP